MSRRSCYDSAPPERWISNELRRDTNQLRQNDHFGVMFDTFYDRRSGFIFYTNPLGALADYSVIDEGQSNTDWNPVWSSHTGTFEGGWTVEMAIPFKTLRYRSGSDQVWGLQLRRAIRHKNEWTYLTPVPQNMAGPQAFNRISSGGTLVGLDSAAGEQELRDQAVRDLARDHRSTCATPRVRNDFDPDFGGDFKYGVTANLTADFTVNTDFAQVEVDEQQVNLTRFNLFFPEKRDFFLEGRGVFDFARGGSSAGGGQGGDGGGGDTPYLFYSRRIGLNAQPRDSDHRRRPADRQGRRLRRRHHEHPGRRRGASSGTPDTNFTVVRVKRDILRRSTIGAMFTNRSESTVPTRQGSNQAYGVDAAFSFYQNISMGAYWAKTETPALEGNDDSYQARFDYAADRYGASAAAPQGRRQLQSRSRLPAPRQLPPLVRVAPLQPAAGEEPAGPQVLLRRPDRVRRQRRRLPRVAPADRQVQHRVQQQRSLQRRRQQELRLPVPAVFAGRAVS